MDKTFWLDMIEEDMITTAYAGVVKELLSLHQRFSAADTVEELANLADEYQGLVTRVRGH